MEKVVLSCPDWLEARREALLFFACLVAAASAVVASHHTYRIADRDLAAAQARQRSSRESLAHVENERKELAAGLGPYRDLVERSVIGEEQRLQWRTVLESGQRSTGLDRVSYSLSPRQPWPADRTGSVGRVRSYRSTMNLKAEFRRETAFVDFLETVSEKASAIPVVRACDISRTGEAAQEDLGNLKAECLIDWFTLQRVGPEEKVPGP